MEPIFDRLPPEGACRVRFKTKFSRRGGQPTIGCDTLTQAAVDGALDGSESLRRYLSVFTEKEREQLGPLPWTLKAEMQFLGSDGHAIDEPTDIEFLYYGTTARKGEGSELTALLMRMVDAQERQSLAREQAYREEMVIREQSHREQLQTVREIVKEAVAESVKAVPVAAAEAAKLLAAGAGPLDKAVSELAKVGEREHVRANDATADVTKMLQATLKAGIAKGTPQPWSKTLVDLTSAAAVGVPMLKKLLN